MFQSCYDDDCGAGFTPPQSFEFEIVDKTSVENLFTNGTYDAADIEITNILNNNEPIEFSFISENNSNMIQIASIDLETEIVHLQIDIADNHIFDFYVDAKRKTEDCCSCTAYNEITVG